MARRRTTRRKTTAKRRSPARRKTTTRRRKAPARRRKTTTRRRKASPARRRTTRRRTTRRRKSPARRKTTTRRRRTARRKPTTRRRRTTRRRKSPARRRKTTRRRKSPARRRRTVRRRSTTRRRPARRRKATSRRRTVRRKKAGVSKKLSLRNAYKWVTNHLTAWESLVALAGGMFLGGALPGLAQSAIRKVTGYNATWMTSGTYTPYISGAAVGALGGFLAYSLLGVSSGTASMIAFGAAGYQVFRLASDMGVFSTIQSKLGLGGAYGYIGNAGMYGEDPFMGDGNFGAAMTYGTAAADPNMDAMFGGTRQMNFY